MKSTTTIAMPNVKYILETRKPKSDYAPNRKWSVVEGGFNTAEEAKQYLERRGCTTGAEYRVVPVFADSYTRYGI
tara:strand:+ start:2751 stop:2975 length:225 start_codon:yes stop_codon:yes gene_type:complete